MKKFCITKPFCRMYAGEDMSGEVSDEVLFGTFIEVLSENDTCAYCRTDYGYCGYMSRWDIEECSLYRPCKEKRQTLYRRCDLLYEPSFKAAPHMWLPAGARITEPVEYDDRFYSVVIGRKKLYFHRSALEKSGGDIRSRACGNALSYLGTPYRWGGKTHNGIDCSGLVFMSFFLCGVDFWRDSDFDENRVFEISHSQVLPGDIAYFKGHIALMFDSGNFIHASAKSGYVVKEAFGESLSLADVEKFGRSRFI